MSKEQPKPVRQELTDPRAYAKYYLSYKLRSQSIKTLIQNPNLLISAYLDYLEYLKAYKTADKDGDYKQIRPIPDKLINGALSELIEKQLKYERAEYIKAFKCTSEDLGLLRQWLIAITGVCLDTDLAVMAHWIWLVKRRAMDMKVDYQIMPILVGEQGSGKSRAIEQLIAPFRPFQMNIKMTQLSDERQYEGFSQNFIVFFDELHGIEKTDMNALKNQLTTPFNTYRKLHTHINIEAPQRCSFIGASNKRINESFFDSTGMRRFWEMTSLDKGDWTAINALDMKALWCGIDENKEIGYLTGNAYSEILSAQKNHINKEPIDEFMDFMQILPEGDAHKEVRADILYKAYCHWCQEEGVTQPGRQSSFTKKLANRNLANYSFKEANTKIRMFKINVNSSIEGSKTTTVLPLKREG